MIESSHPERLLTMLGHQPIVPDGEETAERRRNRMLSAIATSAVAARRERRNRSRLLALTGGLALAAGLVLGVRVWWDWPESRMEASSASTVQSSPNRISVARGEVTVTHLDGQHTTPHGELALAPSDQVAVAPGARAALSLDGANIELAERTIARLGTDPRREFELERGSATFTVSKRTKDASFAVVTRAARIVVVGTCFEVEVSGTGNTHTRVRVTEGRVRVESPRGSSMLAPGETWESDQWPASSAAAPVPPEEEAIRELAQSSTAPTHGALRHPTPVSAAESTLGAEVTEFGRAMQAKRNGDDASALTQIEAFLAHHPRSPLAQEARVERFRLLARLGREGEAARAAREYMAEHPDGFARDEARNSAVESARSVAEPTGSAAGPVGAAP